MNTRSTRVPVRYRFLCLLALLLSACDGTIVSVGGANHVSTQEPFDDDAAWRDAISAEADLAAGDGGLSPATDAATRSVDAETGDGCGAEDEAAVVALVNQAREATGQPPLRCDGTLTRMARDHSQDMCSQGFFSHTAPDGSDVSDRLAAAHVPYWAAGENIAAGQRSPTEVIRDWTQSPGHYANMLGQFTHLGVGYTPCPNAFGHYWTQVFVQR